MKLLTPKVTKDLEGQEITRKILRAEEAEDVLRDVHKRLAKAEADFQATLANQQRTWAIEAQNHAGQLKEMEKEVGVLETKKKQALIPVEMYRKEVEEKDKETTLFLNAIKQKKEKLEETQDLLEEKLDELGEREQNVLQSEHILLAKQASHTERESKIKEDSEILTQAMQSFLQESEQKVKEIEDKQNELILKERSFASFEENLKAKEERLRIREIQVEDRATTLEREFKRLNIPLETPKE